MTPEKVLSHRPKVLSDKQREDYFQKGYILVESIIPKPVIELLLQVTAAFIDRIRSVTRSDAVFDIEPGHTAAEPRLRRLSSPVDHDPAYWDFASDGVVADMMEDLVGPDGLRLHVLKRIERCAATNVDPETGERDRQIPRALMKAYGHVDCGIYCRVVAGGRLAPGARLTPAAAEASSI